MSIPQDIISYVEREFPHHAGAVLHRLVTVRREDSGLFSDRILRCIVFAARGVPSRVESFVELAQKDYRDLIVAAEYDDQWQKIRDFTQPLET